MNNDYWHQRLTDPDTITDFARWHDELNHDFDRHCRQAIELATRPTRRKPQP